jgi:hypothetical protein
VAKRDDEELAVRRRHEHRLVIGAEAAEALHGIGHTIELVELKGIAATIDRGSGRETPDDQPAAVVHSDRKGDHLRVAVRDRQFR